MQGDGGFEIGLPTINLATYGRFEEILVSSGLRVEIVERGPGTLLCLVRRGVVSTSLGFYEEPGGALMVLNPNGWRGRKLAAEVISLLAETR